MSTSTYTSVIFANRPTNGGVVPGETFAVKQDPMLTADDLKEDEVLVETLAISLDASSRVWLRERSSYMPPLPLGSTMRGMTLSRIIASKSPSLPIGTLCITVSGWTELCIQSTKAITPLPSPLPATIKPTDYLSTLGITGLSAYFGLFRIAALKAGELIVVTGAAGATGSAVCQIAKHVVGARVLAIAGSEEKCKWLKELGCDEVLNYKEEGFEGRFLDVTKGKKEEGKAAEIGGCIDVFWDNVGGSMLDLGLKRAGRGSRFVLCGAVSGYNKEEHDVLKNHSMIIIQRIKMQGFIVLDYASEFPEAREELTKWLSEGKIQRQEMIVKGGITAAEKGLLELYAGANMGKMLVEVKPVDDARAQL